MNNKKMFSIIGISLLANLLLLPNMSFAKNNYSYINPVLYISGQYRPGVSHFSQFSVRETHYDTQLLAELKKEVGSVTNTVIQAYANYNVPSQAPFSHTYVAEFEDNTISFSGAVGFSYSEGPRIEIEFSYEEFDVKNSGHSSIDAHRYFALLRHSNNGNTQQNPFAVMRNNGLFIGSVAINSCYDFILDDTPALPYVCGGIGGDFIEFFDELHVKLAYQGKIGISYPIHSKVSTFVDVYYHRVINNKFKNLHVQYVNTTTSQAINPQITSAVATLNVGYFGIEIGARLTF
uniref:Omp-1-11 n=1 Tax=Ehrlichia ewingii TaxID=947 RepID=B1N6B4_9RICK|nr:Omp-1-11 [Ehrlichia ewingii]